MLTISRTRAFSRRCAGCSTTLPPQLHVVLASRRALPLSLARLRSQGLATELDLRDLRFSAEESERFLREQLGQIDDSDAQVVHELDRRLGGGLATVRDRPEGQDEARLFPHRRCAMPRRSRLTSSARCWCASQATTCFCSPARLSAAAFARRSARPDGAVPSGPAKSPCGSRNSTQTICSSLRSARCEEARNMVSPASAAARSAARPPGEAAARRRSANTACGGLALVRCAGSRGRSGRIMRCWRAMPRPPRIWWKDARTVCSRAAN